MKAASRNLRSRFTPTPLRQLLDRGVWKAPWMGPQGELVLLAVTSGHALVGPPRVLSFGSDYISAHDQMWDLLDIVDPPALVSSERALQAI